MLDDEFDSLDERIAEAQSRHATCRRLEILARAATIGGAAVLIGVMTVLPAYRTPTIVFGAFTVALGGLVLRGANRSTRLEIEGELAMLDSRKAQLIDRVAAGNGWRDMTPTVH